MYAAFFSSRPLCPVCSNLPDDTADAATISLQPSLKTSDATYRCRSIHELNTFLTEGLFRLPSRYVERKNAAFFITIC